MKRDAAQLGWPDQPNGQLPVLTAFSKPYYTWAAMDQVLPYEDWPAALTPRSVSCFCAVFPAAALPPPSDTGFPARAAAQAKANAIAQLEERIGDLWPAARPASAASGLSNLYLAGDWLRTGLDAGSVEAAVMGGMQASRALTGYPKRIEGDSDF